MKRFTALFSLLFACTMLPLNAFAEAAPPSEPIPYPVEYPDPTGKRLASEQIDIQPADLDGDGTNSAADLAAFQKFLHGQKTLGHAAFLAADLNHDGETDVFGLALSKAALVQGTTPAPWQVRYDVLDMRWETPAPEDEVPFRLQGFDDAAAFSQWLDGQAGIGKTERDAYRKQYDERFFESNRLAVFLLPTVNENAPYQVRGIREDGDTLQILFGECDLKSSGSILPTVQLTAAVLPRSLADGKTLQLIPCGELSGFQSMWHLLVQDGCEMPSRYAYNRKGYASPIDGLQLEVGSTYDKWDPAGSSVQFTWNDEGERTALQRCPAVLKTLDKFTPEWGETEVTLTLPDNKGKETRITFPYPDRTVTRQTAVFPMQEKGAPEIDSVTVQGDCWGTLANKCKVKSAYGNVLSRGVVGRVGVPITYSATGTVKNAEITLHYDVSELRGIPETNLILLYEGRTYRTVPCVTDTEADTVTFTPEDGGTYILADAYTWYGRWGGDVSEYAYTFNRAAYPSDWERNTDTGCIMALCDKDWAMQNSPDFHVSTPQELAGAVWYVNVMSDNRKCSITLDSDIDLAGLDWAPLGWEHAEFGSTYTATWFSGTIDGQGHVIRNLHVRDGFVQRSQNMTVKDITFENALIQGKTRTGIVCAEATYTTELQDVHASGEIRCSSASDCGALVGSGTVSFAECTADVTVNGARFPYLSANERWAAETKVEHPVTLTLNPDNSVTRGETVYDNISWVILQDGKQVLARNAANEMTLDIAKIVKLGGVSFAVHGSEYQIYLQAYVSGKYVPVSNTVTFRYE